jgi:hypothetical protein
MEENPNISFIAPIAIFAASAAIFYFGRKAGKDNLKPGEMPLTEIEG